MGQGGEPGGGQGMACEREPILFFRDWKIADDSAVRTGKITQKVN
jgi:hypothetical protein